MDQKYLHKQTCCVHNIQAIYACWSFLHTCWSFSSECLSLIEAVQKPFKQCMQKWYAWLLFPFRFESSIDMFLIDVQCLFSPFTIINKCLLATRSVKIWSASCAIYCDIRLLFSNLTIFCIANENKFLPVVFIFVILKQANSLGMTANFCLK